MTTMLDDTTDRDLSSFTLSPPKRVVTMETEPDDWNSPVAVHYGSHIALGVLMLPVTALALGGNGLVIWVFIRFKSLRTPANLLVINLALSDFLMTLFGYPLFITSSFSGHWAFGKAACEFYGMTGAWFALMSINSMAAIAIDRYLIINRGYKITYRQSYFWLLFIWVYSLLWALPPLLGWSRYSTEAYGTTCSYDYLQTDFHDRYFLLSVVIGDFVVPLTIICYCYVWIILKYRSHQQQYGSLLSCSSKSSGPGAASGANSDARGAKTSGGKGPYRSDSERSALMYGGKASKVVKTFKSTEFKIARTVVFVVVVFCVSWTPYAVVCLIGQYGGKNLLSPTVAMVPVILAKFSTVYNPIIYGITHPRFKTAIRKVFPICGKTKTKHLRHYAFRSRGHYRKGDSCSQDDRYIIAVQMTRQRHCRYSHSNQAPLDNYSERDRNYDNGKRYDLGSSSFSSSGDGSQSGNGVAREKVILESGIGSRSSSGFYRNRTYRGIRGQKRCPKGGDGMANAKGRGSGCGGKAKYEKAISPPRKTSSDASFVQMLCNAAKRDPDGKVVVFFKDSSHGSAHSKGGNKSQSFISSQSQSSSSDGNEKVSKSDKGRKRKSAFIWRQSTRETSIGLELESPE